ncbi:DNA polymerase III subunit delta [Mucilaginibacter rubeus]|uniref:DNA polymerase III subunit delta n=1 Tax=Mucilaginibacter rubeus TaxID=2027860 RepID=A0AAE6JAV3_9SPHI|nr:MULTISPECIES: DNA polymerase III subunit delta [Mucilaginibacter]QEM02232.1 DNA polymerase III subunit delta [Mucilaginibacter rubeus]QEM14858.1 DNA polymerase III subunit delta [Mucilaginibacter gossypii]QTE42429.1 DNA polymerase III subunit delta [Mucilaginibacter rubeus]QTE49032.1 DNA polymerase III subunit delta [Mucilaginibacter rubeus]QTE54130.1 DNA polymerase III subunit delta [Mucilaginibacter rubeus]
MTAAEILKDLKNRKFKPLYLLHGEEPYFIDMVSNYIEHHLLPEHERGFNQTVVYGKDTDIMTVLNAAKRYPMMADYQVVLVKEAQDMKWGKDDDNKKSIDPVLSYLENPLPSTILVFCYKYGKFDKRKKTYKAIEKNGLIFESATLYDNKVPAWVEGYVSEKGYKMNQQGSAMIAEYLGNDLAKIANELEKLMLNVSAGQEITLKHIQDNIGISKEYNVFELQTALTKKDAYKVNQIINYFEANPKSNPIVLVLGNLNNFFSKVLVYHYVKDKTPQNLAREMGVNPYFIKDYEQAARNYPLGKIFQVISYLREYDLKSKGVESNAPHGELMKELMFKILH